MGFIEVRIGVSLAPRLQVTSTDLLRFSGWTTSTPRPGPVFRRPASVTPPRGPPSDTDVRRTGAPFPRPQEFCLRRRLKTSRRRRHRRRRPISRGLPRRNPHTRTPDRSPRPLPLPPCHRTGPWRDPDPVYLQLESSPSSSLPVSGRGSGVHCSSPWGETGHSLIEALEDS